MVQRLGVLRANLRAKPPQQRLQRRRDPIRDFCQEDPLIELLCQKMGGGQQFSTLAEQQIMLLKMPN
jgi:hypothetical protein